MNKKRNTIIAIIVICLIFLSGGIYYILNYSKDESSFTVLEKKWITDNLNKVIDVNVYNDVPVFGYNGEGIIFDFLDYVTESNQINFNKISYYTTSDTTYKDISFRVLKSNEAIGKNDITLYEDYYAIYGDSSDSISLNSNLKLGILEEDKEILNNYFKEELTLTSYKTVSDLIKGLDSKEIDNIVLPLNKYMDVVLSNKLNVVYHLTDLKLNYVLRVNDDTVYSILRKSYLEYLKDEYKSDYSKNYLNMYFDSNDITDVQRKSYNAKSYKYGYVINMPYENGVNDEFVGTISNYLTDFNSIADTDIEVVKYKSIDELKTALISKEIDFALGNFDYSNLNMDKYVTSSISNLEYVVLSMEDYAMNSIKGISDKTLSVVSGSKMYQLCKDNDIKTKAYDDTDWLLKNIDDSSIILIDKQTYFYYKDSKLKDYKVNYEGVIKDGYRFVMNKGNDTFNELFDYYVSNVDYNQIKYLYRTSITIDRDYTTIKVFAFIVLLVSALSVSIFLLNRKNITNKSISKEQVLKYIDPMTSLKNRSYLNMNIYDWDDNVIFPQGIVVMDLNSLKEVNDKLGREAGDEIIKRVASILINNQLENTDIIRSGGDEFLIYMVGYDEKLVSDYTKKLMRLMKNIPNSLGIEIGYSMILDEVKTVDDAINEAISMMMKNKEKRK